MRTTLFAVLAATLMTVSGVQAQSFPSRPIKVVVPAAPGTATDAVTRYVAEELGRGPKWATVVENRVGANGIIAMETVARAPADGYTLLNTPSTLYINKALQPKVNYEIGDFVPLAKAAGAYLVLVVPANSPFHTLQDAIAYMKANPGKVNYASAGSGSVTHLAFALLASMAGVQALHVPYKGGGGALTDTISGQVAMTITAIATANTNIAAGRLRPLAITGPRRSSALPEVPTIAELGYRGYEAVSGLGFMTLKGTPQVVVDRLSGEILKIVSTPAFAAFAKAQGLEVDAMDGSAYSANGQREMVLWQKAIADSGAKAD